MAALPEDLGSIPSQVWWLIPVIPTFRKLKQEKCHEFKVSLGYTVKPCLKTNNKQNPNK